MARWIRTLVQPTARYPFRRRDPILQALLLEDRLTPTGSAPFISLSNAALSVSESSTELFRIGYVGDLENDTLTLTANTGTYPGSTFTFTGNAGPFAGTQEVIWKYTAADGLVPAATKAVIVSVTDGTSAPVDATFNLTINNVTPVVLAAANQTASVGQLTTLNLGSFTDPGADNPWSVAADLDGDGNYETTFNKTAAGSLGTADFTYAFAGTYTANLKVTDKDTATSTVASFTVTVTGDTSYVDDSFSIYTFGQIIPGDIDPSTPAVETGKLGYNAFTTISAALPLTATGGTVKVFGGSYAENVAVTKSVTILGPNAGIDPNLTAHTGSAVVTPGVNDVANGSVFAVTAAGVTIDGLTIDGDAAFGGGVAVNSAEANAANGVFVNGVGSAVIRNNIIRNVSSNGVRGNATTTVSGSTITANLIDNVPLNGPTYFGRGVLIQNNFYADITNNTISRVRTGVQTNNFSQADPANSHSISNNTITAYVRGLYHNLHYQAASPFSITGNTLTAEAGSPAGNGGLMISSIQDAVSATISNNTVSGFDTNLDVWNIPTTAGITISGGTISGAGSYGLNFNNFDAVNANANSGTHTLTLSNVNFAASNPTAIRVWDSTSNTTGTILNLALSGVTVNGTTGTGVLVDGADASLKDNTLGNTKFSGFSGSGNFVRFANAAHAGDEVDGTLARYNGVLGSGLSKLSNPTGYEVEDLLSHALDTAGVGFLRTTGGTVWVTTNTAGIQRGIDVATSGDTVNVEAGVYDENILINKPLNLAGANDAFDGTSGSRGTESVIRTAASSNTPGEGGVSVVIVASSQVSFLGFTVDGATSAATTNVTLTGTSTDVDAQAGIRTYGEVSNLTVANNIIENLSYIGLDFGGYDAGGTKDGPTVGAVNTDGSVTGNLVRNVGAYNDEGTGIRIYNNFYADVSSNTLRNVRMGIETGNFWQANTGSAPAIANNDIQARRRGVFYNLHYANASDIPVTGNTISATADDLLLGGSIWVGAYVISQANAVISTFADNTISGAGSNHILRTGFTVLNVWDTAAVTLTGGIVSDVEYGVWVTDTAPNGFGAAAANMAVTISGITITSATNGVFIDDTSGGFSAGATVTGNAITGNDVGVYVLGGSADIYDNTFDSVIDNGTDILLASGAGLVTIADDNRFAGDSYYIDNLSSQNFTFTSNTVFEDSGNYVIENHMYHKVDATTSGRIVWVANNLYVTSSGTDSSIQRGIDAVPDNSTGWTVNVEAGTYVENIAVNESVTLLGAKAGNAVAGRVAAFVSGAADPLVETIVRPSFVGTSAGAASDLFAVSKPGITIDGFVLDGHNPMLAAGPLTVAGQTIHARFGVTNLPPTAGTLGGAGAFATGLSVDNLIAQNLIGGVVADGPYLPTQRGSVTDSHFRNISGGPSGANGIGVATFFNYYLDVQRNVFDFSNAPSNTNSVFAIWSQNHSDPVAGGAVQLSDNAITLSQLSAGFFINNHFGNPNELRIAGNTINAAAGVVPASNKLARGIRVWSTLGNSRVTIEDNTIGSAGGQLGTGLSFWNNPSKLVTVDDTTIDRTNYGVIIDSSTSFGSASTGTVAITDTSIDADVAGIWHVANGAAAGDQTLTLENVTVSTGATGTSVRVVDTVADGFLTRLELIGGNVFTGGVNSLEIDGSQTRLVGDTLADTSFAGNSGQFVLLANNAAPSATIIDGSSATFDLGFGLKTAAQLTLAQKYVLETKLTHRPDSTVLSLIETTPNNIYVPAGQTIQGGIDAVPDNSTGWTVNVDVGTFAETVTVNEDVTLLGPNAGISAGKVAGPRGTEATITSPVANLATPLVTVTADNATIDGFLLDGDNAIISGGILLLDGTTFSNAAIGLRVTGADGVLATNNRFRNFVTGGYEFGVYGDLSTIGSGTVSNSSFQVIGPDDVGTYGPGVAFYDFDSAVDLVGNSIGTTHYGAYYDALYQPSSAVNVTGNTIDANSRALSFQETGGTTGLITVSNNAISLAAGGKTGLLLWNIGHTAGFSFSSNTLSGAGSGSRGIDAFNLTTPVTLTGTVSGFETGVYLTNYLFPYSAEAGSDSTLTLNGMTVTAPAGGTGVFVDGTTNTGSAKLATITLTGTTLSGGAAGLNLAGPKAKAGSGTVNGGTFNGSTQAIVLSGGAYNGSTLDASGASINTVVPSGASLPQLFVLEDAVTHQLDDAAQGTVVFTPNVVYVTQASGSIQRGLDSENIAASGIVHVDAGTFNEDVEMALSTGDRVGLQLLGAGAGSSIIAGVVGGDNHTVQFGTNQVLDGFTITRQNIAGTSGENNFGIVNVSGSTGYTIRNNRLVQNRTAYYVNGSGSSGTFTRNVVEGNRTGILFIDPNNGTHSISENVIRDNRTFGIIAQVGATNLGGITIVNNSITGNYASQIENNTTEVLNARGNWFGTTTVTALAAAAPTGMYPNEAPPVSPFPYSISGTGVALTDISPFLWSGTDTMPAIYGFQGGTTELGVTTLGGDFDGGTDYRVTEGLDYNGGSASTVHVRGGSYISDPVNLTRTVTVMLEGAATIGSLASDIGSGRTVNLNGYSLTTGGNDSSTTFNGTFVGGTGSSVIKQGTGTLNLTANNSSYTDSLDVAAGTVNLSGTLGGTASVSGTLTGTGTILGDVDVATGGSLTGTLTVDDLSNDGTVSPSGSAVGTITARSYTQGAGGLLVLDVNGPTIDRDQLVVTTGPVDLDGNLTINSTGSAISFFSSTSIIDNQGAGAVSGTFIGLASGSVIVAGSNSFKIFYAGGTGNDVTLFTVPFAGPYAITYADDGFTAPDGTAVSTPNGTSYIGYDAFPKIQSAINNTTTNGTIIVYAGNYGVDSINVGANPQTVTLMNTAAVTVDGVLAASNSAAKVNFSKGSLTIGGGTSTFAGTLSGFLATAGFVKQGTGTLTLTNPGNNYIGATKVTGGTLATGTDEVIPNGSAVSLNGGALDLNGNWETIASLAGTSGGSVSIPAASKLTAGATGVSTTFAGAISGSGEFVKQGNGTLVLSGNNSFSGLTTIEAGAVQLGSGGTTGSLAGPVLAEQGTTLIINRSSGTLLAPLAVANTISGDGGVTLAGSGAIRLTGATSYTGGTTVSKGTLVASTDDELGGSGDVTLLGTGALFADDSFSTSRAINADTTAAIAVASGETLTFANTTVEGGTFNGPGSVASDGSTIHGSFVGPSGSVTANTGTTLRSVSNGGTVSVPASQAVSLEAFANLAGGTLSISGTATADGFTSLGKTTVAGTLMNTGTSKLILGGGSSTTNNGVVDVGPAGAYASGAFVRNTGDWGHATGITTVDYGARFSSIGTEDGVVTQNGGVYAPGSSPGSSASGRFTVNGGGVFEFELTNATGTAGAASGWDLTTVRPSTFNNPATLALTATSANPYTLKVKTRLNSGDYNIPGTAANFNPFVAQAWKFLDASHANTTISGTFDPAAFNLDTSELANAANGTFTVEARDGGKNFYVVYTPNGNVASVVVNTGAIQRSRLTTITVNFVLPMDASTLTGLGAITLSKPGVVVQTGAVGSNGRILVSPASGMVSSITLTFDNADASGETAGVEFGSLSDGRWQLAIPSANYTSPLNGTLVRRLFGDWNGDGTVDGATDFANLALGNLNGTNNPFDYNNDGTIDGATDFAQFGTRFGRTI